MVHEAGGAGASEVWRSGEKGGAAGDEREGPRRCKRRGAAEYERDGPRLSGITRGGPPQSWPWPSSWRPRRLARPRPTAAHPTPSASTRGAMTTRARCVSLPGLATVVRLEWVSRPARARLGLSLAPPFKSPCTNPTANGRPGVMQVFVTVGETILAPAQNQPPALLAPTVARARTKQEIRPVGRVMPGSTRPTLVCPLVCLCVCVYTHILSFYFNPFGLRVRVDTWFLTPTLCHDHYYHHLYMPMYNMIMSARNQVILRYIDLKTCIEFCGV